jgi:hypothetical protein
MNELHRSDNEMKERSMNMEVNRIDHEKQFARLVAAEIAGSLQVNYGDRDIVVKLLTTTLEKQLCKSGGLLEQYLHTQLDIIAETINHKFDISDYGVGVNYGYATHAKLNDILETVKVKYKPKPDFNGTI